jgi:hypothetical protein
VEAQPAIVIEPMEALRLESGSFQARARTIGLDLRIRRTRPQPAKQDPAAYDATNDALPPGFSD